MKAEVMELERKLRRKLKPPQKMESTEQAINRKKNQGGWGRCWARGEESTKES